MGCLFRGVTRNASDSVFLGKLGVLKNVLDDGTSLVAGGTKNSDELGHGWNFEISRNICNKLKVE